jgi:hypothetical protein
MFVSMSLILPEQTSNMLSHFALAIVLCIVNTTIIYPNFTLALKSETTSISIISNHTDASGLIDDDVKLLPGSYTPDQINDIIYHLYQLIQNSSSTEIGYNHDVAVLIDLICSNELYENAVEACDIVTELSIESNNY